ncbi:purine-nucleoside phosphorylase [Planosporangium thailandense]|uniref:Purine nucleoside phosphorylase n=2 Tax=Planosporangium thailandense TaxID=765197 RepID=A0ABX0XRB1_9ACTN|nr:purine-nucleoside phosphorylase [Planosporangium thailandense]
MGAVSSGARWPEEVRVQGSRDPYELAVEAAAALAEATSCPRHDAVVVLGSGWAPAADAFGSPAAELPVAELPGFHPPVADGHLGLVRSYPLGDARVLCFLGRTHLYEGLGVDPVAHAVRTAASSGCRTAVLTNANGSLRPEWGLGTGVVIRDHLSLSGVSPLRGPRFVDLSDCWSPRLRGLALAADPDLVEGVYAFLPGPHYETPAEARMLRTLGADVVGMSTVIEAIAAREAGLELLGLSVVTAIELDSEPTDPTEVVAVAAASATKLGAVIRTVLEQATCQPGGTP